MKWSLGLEEVGKALVRFQMTFKMEAIDLWQG